MTMSDTERTNQQWIDELRGLAGFEKQEAAHRELLNILYIRIYNYLRLRQSDIYVLRAFSDEEVASIAVDFAHETVVKLSEDNFALFEHFRGEGKFVNWVTKIALRLAGAELRRPYWQKRFEEPEDTIDPSQLDPEFLSQAAFLQSIIHDCISRLPERQRIAFEQSIIHNKSALEICEMLDIKDSKDKEQTVYQLVYRARINLRKCIENRGIGPDAFDIFK